MTLTQDVRTRIAGVVRPLADPFPHLPRTKASLIGELLQRKRTRDREQAFVLEGVRPVLEVVLNKSPDVTCIVLTPSFFKRQTSAHREGILRSYAPVYQVSENIFERLSNVETGQGILAVVRKPVWQERAVFAQAGLFGVFGEQLQDPANVGAIIRTAAALQVSALWLTPDSADVFNPKVVRATAGSLMTLPIFHCLTPQVFVDHECSIVATESSRSGAVPIQQVRAIPRRTILAVGNESRGLAKSTIDIAAMRIHIPVNTEVESLNVATATAILIFYLGNVPRQ